MIEIFPVFRQAHWHDGHGTYVGVESTEFFDRFFQMDSVIDTRTEDDLCVQLDISAGKIFDLLHKCTRVPAPHHLHPELRIGGVYGYEERTEMLFDDAVEIPFRYAGQGDVRPLEQAGPRRQWRGHVGPLRLEEERV